MLLTLASWKKSFWQKIYCERRGHKGKSHLPAAPGKSSILPVNGFSFLSSGLLALASVQSTHAISVLGKVNPIYLSNSYNGMYFFTFFFCFVFRSLRQKPRLNGGQINYREEEKRILDSILGRDVYDNRIRPSGRNGTGKRLF